jgi:2-hydroxychromene-2-carboxylate isomerase
MTQQFAQLGGAASSNPSRLKRWVASRIMRRWADPVLREKSREKFETRRCKAGLPHRVEYFHQIDDPYSHLAVQLLAPLLEHYAIDIVPHLVSASIGANTPEPTLLAAYARHDAGLVAPHYGLDFDLEVDGLNPEHIALATRILAQADPADVSTFARLAVELGEVLWCGNAEALQQLAERAGAMDAGLAAAVVERGNRRRQKMGHYSGAMFYYAGEWYWGVDRLYHLENRLQSLGASNSRERRLLAPRPLIDTGRLSADGRLTLEIYMSLRSPYTSIIFDRAVKLATDTDVALILRPVLPMVMRGVPVTREKGHYIFRDTAREAQTLGLNWGCIVDPIGDPVRRAYSLYPWADQQGRGAELLSAFMHAAFFQGIDTNTDAGMQRVVEAAGLDWHVAQQHADSDGYAEQLEENRLAMYGFGCWGVPGFRLLDERGETLLAVWGQDRLWLVARTIQQVLAGKQ